MILTLSSFSHDWSIVIDKNLPAYELQLQNYYMQEYFKAEFMKILQ